MARRDHAAPATARQRRRYRRPDRVRAEKSRAVEHLGARFSAWSRSPAAPAVPEANGYPARDRRQVPLRGRGGSMTGARYVRTKDAKDAIRGREAEIVR